MSLSLEDVPSSDHAHLSRVVGQMLEVDAVLSAIVMTECLRLRSTRTVEEIRECCLVVVTWPQICRRAFRDLMAHDLGEVASDLVEAWAVQGGVICWPQLKRKLAEQLRRVDLRPDGPMALAVSQETPPGSICVLVMTVVNDRAVTGVVQYPMPEFLASTALRGAR